LPPAPHRCPGAGNGRTFKGHLTRRSHPQWQL